MTNETNDENKPNTSLEIEADLVRRLIQTLDKVLSNKNWEETLFLKANKKQLLKLKEQSQDLLNEMTSSKEEENQKKIRQIPPGYNKIYISLYQSEPNNLIKWQSAIRALEKYSISRSIYREEEHVRNLIRNKFDPSKEAYIVVLVKETNIIKPYLGKKIQDRYGNELITIKEGAIELFNIIEFVHENKHYSYSPEDGLVLI